MRVLFIHCRYRSPAGEQAVVERETASLREAGHDVELLRFDNPSGPAATGAALLQAPWNLRSAATTTEALKRFEPDVVHVHNTWFAASPSVPAAVRRHGVPMVTTLHNYRFVCVSGGLFRDGSICTKCLDGSSMNAVRHRCYRGSAALSATAIATDVVAAKKRTTHHELYIAPSAFVADTAVRAGFDSSTVIVVPHAAPDPGERPAPPSHSRTVLFVGRLADGKGVERLLRAWDAADTGDLTLEIIGNGPNFDGVWSTLPDGVRALGWRDSVEVSQRMLQARTQVVPSEWHEPFGLVLIEALAAGLPVVAFDTSSMADIVGEGALAITEPDDDALAEALSRVVDDAVVDNVGTAARRRYESHYRPEVHLQGLLDVYTRAMDGV